MPKVICSCRSIISLSEIPNPNEWLTISDIEYDKLSDKIDSEELYMQMTSIIKCNSCKRIHIYWDGNFSKPTTYIEDNT